jgi:hypothetical protein
MTEETKHMLLVKRKSIGDIIWIIEHIIPTMPGILLSMVKRAIKA